LEKLAAIVTALREALASNGEVVIVFADEYTMERQPSVASDYDVVGATHQPLAQRSHQSNATWRYRGYLNALTGQVTYLDAKLIGVKQLVDAHARLRAAYPNARVIYVVEDNWPVHYHPDVLAALQPQTTPFPLKTPPSWPTEPSAKARRLDLPIQLLPLPTYASWCNPIEKLWRWLKQEVLHLHRYANDWKLLKEKTKEFLDQFDEASADLLCYVGLTESSKLYGPVLATEPPKT
jgi:DDE superfamily endonuclease